MLQNAPSGSFYHNAVRGIQTHHFWWSSGWKEDPKTCEVRTSCCRQSCSLFLPQWSLISQRNFLPPHELKHEQHWSLWAVSVPCLVRVSGILNTWVSPWCISIIFGHITSRWRQTHRKTDGICPALAHFSFQTAPADEGLLRWASHITFFPAASLQQVYP